MSFIVMVAKTAKTGKAKPSTSRQSLSLKSAKGKKFSKISSRHARWSKITKVTKTKPIKSKRCARSTGKGRTASAPAIPISATTPRQPNDLEREKEIKIQSDLRKTVFQLLHRPSGFEYFYHLFVVLLIITSGCVLNILKPKNPWDDIYIYNHYRTIHLAMCGVDSFLAGTIATFMALYTTLSNNRLCFSVFLFAEMLTRLWAAEHNPLYCGGLAGKWRYLADHPYLAMDLFAWLTFLGYVLFSWATLTEAAVPSRQLLESDWWAHLDGAFRIAHVLQVLHTYRLIYKLVRPIFATIQQQANQLLLALFVVVIVMILCSVMLFLCNLSTYKSSQHEHPHHQPATDFTAAIWHCFVAFSTVGYDTHLPYSRESLAVLAACALVGVWSFMLPSIILGNGLSITVSEQRRLTFRYVSIAEMIRTAMAHHQSGNRPDYNRRQRTSKKKPQKLRLVTDHLHSLTKLEILKRPPARDQRLFKINYDGFDSDEHSMLADDDEALWDKLLTIGDQQQQQVMLPSSIAKSPAFPHSGSLNESLRTQTTSARSATGAAALRQAPKSANPGSPQSGSTRVMDCFENMDLSKYSNDNSMLWYNLGLIEDGMDEMTDVVCHHLLARVDQIHRLSGRLVQSLAELRRRRKRRRSREEASTREDVR